MSEVIKDKDDVIVVACKRVIVSTSIDVVVVGCDDVQVHMSRAKSSQLIGDAYFKNHEEDGMDTEPSI